MAQFLLSSIKEFKMQNYLCLHLEVKEIEKI